MTTESADLSSLRIRRSPVPDGSGRRLPKWVIPAAVLLVAAALLVFLFRGTLGRAKEVELATATLTSPTQANTVLTASGYVVAQVKAAVASKGTGRLEFLGVEEGDKVKRGEIIARLEDSDVLAALAQAQANLSVARADSADAHRTLERTRELFRNNLASKAELDAAEARYARVAATIRYAVATVTSAEVAVENTRIRAPFDGTVLTKNADVGEVVAPFASSANARGAVVTMADMNSLLVEADVSESNITRVKPGQPCSIVLDAYPDRSYPGTVHKIVPTADRAKATVLTKVKFTERDERVLPEMSAKVQFLSEAKPASETSSVPVVTVPLSAVVNREGRPVVLMVHDGKVQETPVSTGEVLGDRIVVREGVAQGDAVVARPEPSLVTGSTVVTREKR
jgi:RND family efflux transporter MFP subunit